MTQREPMVFAVAGMIFGFVLGYMAKGLGERAEPRPRPAVEAPRAAAGGPVTSGSPAPGHNHPSAAPDADEIKALEGLAARDKGNARVRVQLGNLYMDHGRYSDAVRWYRDALALQPDDLDARVDLGASLLSAGEGPAALQELDRALQKDPAHKKALFNKGLALMQSGRTAEAVTVWEGLLKRYPGDPQLQELQGQLDRMKAGRGPGAS